MKQKDKELLLKDLYARVPYHTFVSYKGGNVDLTQYIRSVKLEDCVPYLRPMSSMTEEEKESPQYSNYLFSFLVRGIDVQLLNYVDIIDWLNAHHFDYRGLIEKGLAYEAPEGMYKK